ncbi:MAG TPA: hypothetical protein PK760_07090, partial [Flavobacteriales bacterium]|nr:hypothetical protein [Flavobacteriales bacterium]
MRRLVLVLVLVRSVACFAQNTWMPLSREVERPYAAAAGQFRSDFHTSIRPYRMSEVTALNVKDSLNSTALLPALDRWAGVRNGRSFRWGPLLDAQAMFSA